MTNPNHISAFDKTLQTTHVWLNELTDDMEWDDKHRSYLTLRTVLHALRDRLHVDEAVHLAAEMPMLVRGFYFEGWDPSGKPMKPRDAATFLEEIDRPFSDDEGFDPARAARAVFRLLDHKISAGEISDVRHALPKPLRELWP